jgi:hypothetical protein
LLIIPFSCCCHIILVLSNLMFLHSQPVQFAAAHRE